MISSYKQIEEIKKLDRLIADKEKLEFGIIFTTVLKFDKNKLKEFEGNINMKFILKKLLISSVFLMGLFLLPQAEAAKKKTVIPQQKFWKPFREAFLRKNFKKLKSMTAKDLMVKGIMDSDPIIRVSSKKFESCFGIIYSRNVGLTDPDKDHEKFIMELPDVSEVVGNDGGALQENPRAAHFRVSDLEFGKDKSGQFKMTTIYLNTVEPIVTKACAG